jgi:hypothetical protein
MFLKYTVSQVMLVLAALLMLNGCQFLEKNPAATWLVVEQATLRYIDDDPQKALRVRAVADEVGQSLEGNESVTLAVLDGRLRALVKWDELSIADRQLLDGLITMLVMELEARFTSDVLKPEDIVRIRTLVGWVVQSTYLVVP